MARTFEAPWDWPESRRLDAERLSRVLHRALRSFLEEPARDPGGRPVPCTLITTQESLDLLEGCFPVTRLRGRAPSLRAVGWDVYCHPQAVYPDMLRLRQGLRSLDVYHAPDLSDAQLELYRCLRADGMVPDAARLATLELTPS